MVSLAPHVRSDGPAAIGADRGGERAPSVLMRPGAPRHELRSISGIHTIPLSLLSHSHARPPSLILPPLPHHRRPEMLGGVEIEMVRRVHSRPPVTCPIEGGDWAPLRQVKCAAPRSFMRKRSSRDSRPIEAGRYFDFPLCCSSHISRHIKRRE